MISVISSRLGKHPLAPATDTESPLATRTDPEKLRQVLANLVDNAIRFSPNGGRVTVGAARRGETIVLTGNRPHIGPDDPQLRVQWRQASRP